MMSENLGYNKIGGIFGLLSNITYVISLIFIIIYLLFFVLKYKQLNEREKIISLFFYIALSGMFAYYVLVSNVGDSGYQIKFAQYFIFDLSFGFFLIPIFIVNINKNKQSDYLDILPKFSLAFFLIIVSFSYSNYFGYANPWITNTKSDPDILNVANYINSTNYTFGYASHWNGQIISELTNGKVEMFVFKIEYNKIVINKEVQDKTHEIDFLRDGNCFVIFKQSEYGYLPYVNAKVYGKEIYTSDHYSVFDLPTAKVLNY